MEPLETKVSIAESYGQGIGNLVLENCRFFKKPNFAGERDDFGNTSRQFNVMIPNELADQLRQIGWKVKTLLPRPDFPEDEARSFLKVNSDFWFARGHEGDMNYEKGPDVWIIQSDQREKLTSKTVPILDNALFENVDMEIRGWEYRPEENPGEYTARLVTFVAVMRPNALREKYGLR